MKKKTLQISTFIFFLSLVLAACTARVEIPSNATHAPVFESTPSLALDPIVTETPAPGNDAPIPFPTNIRIEDNIEYQIPFMLGFDAIRPVYAPIFAPANVAPLLDDELVMGLVIDGEAKAYPITVLRSREMVNDELGGLPILVTW